MIRYENIIFDFDGTLYDTIGTFCRGLNIVSDFFGLEPLDIEAAKRLIGPPFDTIIRNIYPAAADEEVYLLKKKISEYYLTRGSFEEAVFPGQRRMLEQLSTAGAKLGIASMKDRSFVEITLEDHGVRRLFGSVQGYGPGVDSKKMALAACMEELHAEKARTVLVGDLTSDWQAARTCGIDFIAALYGYGQWPENMVAMEGTVFYARSIPLLAAYLLSE